MEAKIITPLVTVLVLYALAGLAGRRRREVVLVLRFQNQEAAVEGFLRKVAYWSRITGRRVRLVVLVDRSRDLTEAIVGRLSGELGLLTPGDAPPESEARLFDARPLTGRQLARLSLHRFLAA